MRALGAVMRFVVTAIVLSVTAWLVPGFRVGSFGSALLLALVIAGLGWLAENLIGREVTPFGRGIVGFLLSAIVLYLAQFIVPGSRVTLLGALLAALVIGIFDLFVPVSGIGKRKTPTGIH
ncbi:phage holin family protein [Gorillibacterium timonense]|uniref:phage holin family protein n=1 Tax=Gorillibacterium timonense TaxID=1689269 RepID=UPI00071C4429|nr:phage holin family protein [Gorillibacterium timonense]